jgi:hypothetical protein
MRARSIFILTSLAAMGCTSLIGVRDIYLDENAANGSEDGGASSSSGNPSSSSGGNGDSGTDAPISCDGVDLQTSKDHCGRCGHSCGGGECNAGKCQPLQIGAVANAPLNFIATSQDHVFVSPIIKLTTDEGGIWRIPKSGGAPVLFANVRYAEDMRVLDKKLFFVVEDNLPDASTPGVGGLYTCGIDETPPCNAVKLVDADNPAGITVDGTRVIFNDESTGHRAFDTNGNTITTISQYIRGRYLYADGTALFFHWTPFNSTTSSGRTQEVLTDGGTVTVYDYTAKNAGAGVLVGTKDALYIAAFDWTGTLQGGFVHRYPRTATGLPCDYGGTTNKRPYGIAVDTQRIYWTNMGEGANEPFTNGSLATCELAGCCTTPETIWTGNGEPGGVVTDDAFVYWVLGTGAVWKVAKP